MSDRAAKKLNAKELRHNLNFRLHCLVWKKKNHSLGKDYVREERGAPSTRGISEAKPRFRVQTPLPRQPFYKLQQNKEIN